MELLVIQPPHHLTRAIFLTRYCKMTSRALVQQALSAFSVPRDPMVQKTINSLSLASAAAGTQNEVSACTQAAADLRTLRLRGALFEKAKEKPSLKRVCSEEINAYTRMREATRAKWMLESETTAAAKDIFHGCDGMTPDQDQLYADGHHDRYDKRASVFIVTAILAALTVVTVHSSIQRCARN